MGIPEAIESLMWSIVDLPQTLQQADAVARFRADHPEWVAELQSRMTTGARGAASSTEQRLAGLQAWTPRAHARYRLQGEVARGGMGAILRAYDQDLGRTLAIKVMLGQGVATGDAPRPADTVEPQVLQRFLDEAQITGQLDHPGVVPVHELGIDAQGRLYFTMRLVKGRTADAVFALARAGEEGWTKTRALEVILKVCDTLAYAHSKQVVHRDIKPSNVMVGRFGEVYVMDWGLAKVLGGEDHRDLRIQPQGASLSRVRTDRSTDAASDPDSPVLTMDGAVVGTPCYMPPEQAEGRVEQLGVRSDVYAVGAMLYELLAGMRPYVRPGQQASPYAVLRWVSDGPPAPLSQVAPDVPGELVAICEKAMARRAEARYADATELAEDLRAYLERRVVRAYRTGALAEMRAWVRRNKGMAAGLLAAVLALAGGGTGAVVYARQATLARAEAVREKDAAEAEKGRAEEARGAAQKALLDFRAEQERKAELEARLRIERRRKDNANREWEKQQEARTRAEHALVDIDAQIRSLVALDPTPPAASSPAVSAPSGSPASGLVAAREALLTQLARHTVAGEAWVRGRWLTWSGQAEAAVTVLVRGLRDDGAADAESRAFASALRPLRAHAIHRALAHAHAMVGERRQSLHHYDSALLQRDWNGLEAMSVPTARDHARVLVGGTAGAELVLQRLRALGMPEDARDPEGARGPEGGRGDEQRREVADWLAERTLADVGLRTLRAAAWLVQGRLAKARDDVAWLAAREQVADLEAMDLRVRGSIASALAVARRGQAGNPGFAQLHACVLEEARAARAAHQPHAALALLGAHCARFAGEKAFPHLHVEVLEEAARCQAIAGRWDDALQSLAAAQGIVSPRDAETRARLDAAQVEVLLGCGRSAEAVRVYADRERAAVEQGSGDLAGAALLDLAVAAEGLGDAAVTDALLRRPLPRAGHAPLAERAEALLLRAQLLHRRGQAEHAAAARSSLEDMLPHVDDDGLHARARVHAAEVLAASGKVRDALPQLDRAARKFEAWLRAYARFRGNPAAPARLAAAATLGRTAIGTLADAAPKLAPADMGRAWYVLETFRAPVPRLVLARSARLRSAGAGAEAFAAYEAERARVLELEFRLQRIDATKESGAAAERHRLVETLPHRWSALANTEERLRAQQPAYCGAVFPRVAQLEDVQRSVPAATALVVYAVAGERTLAFVLSRTVATLVALPEARDLRPDLAALAASQGADHTAPAALARMGRALIEPVLGVLAGAPVRTLLLAPVAAMLAVPFEACLVANGAETQALIERFDVAYVPSGTAWFDQFRQARRARARTAGTVVALAGEAEVAPPATLAWVAATMGADAAGERAAAGLPASVPPAGLEIRSSALHVFAGRSATEAAFAPIAASARTIAWSLPLQGAPGAPAHAWLQCGSHGDGLREGGVEDGHFTVPELRDLACRADLAILQNAAVGDPVDEAEAMAVLAHALASGGAGMVVTAPSRVDVEVGRRLLGALMSPAGAADRVAAWGSVCRQEIRRGRAATLPFGLRLWTGNRQ